MPENIAVEQIGADQFQVLVIDGEGQTSHRVTAKTDDYSRIAGEPVEPTELVRRAVALLLAREHAKPVPPECDLTILIQYFAEFERAKKIAAGSL